MGKWVSGWAWKGGRGGARTCACRNAFCKAALICASARRTVEEECARVTLLGRRMFNDLPVNAS